MLEPETGMHLRLTRNWEREGEGSGRCFLEVERSNEVWLSITLEKILTGGFDFRIRDWDRGLCWTAHSLAVRCRGRAPFTHASHNDIGIRERCH